MSHKLTREMSSQGLADGSSGESHVKTTFEQKPSCWAVVALLMWGCHVEVAVWKLLWTCGMSLQVYGSEERMEMQMTTTRLWNETHNLEPDCRQVLRAAARAVRCTIFTPTKKERH